MGIFRKSKRKQEREKWLQVGNFLLGVEKNKTGQYFVCKSVAKDWCVKWRDDTMMFPLMVSLMSNEGSREYLHALLTLQYRATTYPHDMVSIVKDHNAPFMDGFATLLQSQADYENGIKNAEQGEEGREKADEAALKDLQELSVIEEAVKQELSEGNVHE